MLVLVMGERRRFSGRPARHQAVGALVDLPLDELLKGLCVNLAVLERRDQRRDRASKWRHWHGGKLLRPGARQGGASERRRDNRVWGLRRQEAGSPLRYGLT